MSMVRERVYSDKKLAEILLASLPCSCQSETTAQGLKYIRRKPYSFVHFGACSAGKWSMSMIHPITVSNFAVFIVRNCTGNIRKRKGEKAFDNSSVTLVEKTSLSRTLWTGGVSIAVRPVGKPSTEPNKK